MTNANSTSPASLPARLAQRATFVLLAIAVIAIALLTRSWRDARAATAHLQATLDAQQHTIAAATQRESARDTQLAQTLAQIAAAKQRVKTPAEAAAALASALPPPIQIDLPSATSPAPKSAHNSGASTSEAAAGPGRTSIHEWISRAENSGRSTIPTGSPAPPPAASTGDAEVPCNVTPQGAQPCGPSSAPRPPSAKPHPLFSWLSGSAASRESAATAPASASSPTNASEAEAARNTMPESADEAAAPSSAQAASHAQMPPGELPATLRIPQQDLKLLYDALEDCRACQASLAAAQSDLADERTQLTATAAERDAALKSAKGGSFWTRLKRSAKWFAIGAALGAIATRTARP